MEAGKEIASPQAGAVAVSVEGARLFIAYSHVDEIFARDLALALRSYGFQVVLDRDVLVAGVDWERELAAQLTTSDTFIFVTTNNSLTSGPSLTELARAKSQGKRIIPVIAATVSASLPAELSRPHHVTFCGEGRTFARALVDLVTALKVDLDWLRNHSHYSDLAQRWKHGEKSNAFILRPASALIEAYEWSTKPPKRHSVPQLVADFLDASRQQHESDDREQIKAKARRRLLAAAATAVIAVLGFVLYLSIEEIREAERNVKRMEKDSEPLQAEIKRLMDRIGVLESSVTIGRPEEAMVDSGKILQPFFDNLKDNDDAIRRGARNNLAFVLQQQANGELNRDAVKLAVKDGAYRTGLGVAIAIEKLGELASKAPPLKPVPMANPDEVIRDLETLKQMHGRDDTLKRAADAAIKVVKVAALSK